MWLGAGNDQRAGALGSLEGSVVKCLQHPYVAIVGIIIVNYQVVVVVFLLGAQFRD